MLADVDAWNLAKYHNGLRDTPPSEMVYTAMATYYRAEASTRYRMFAESMGGISRLASEALRMMFPITREEKITGIQKTLEQKLIQDFEDRYQVEVTDNQRRALAEVFKQFVSARQ
jgi:hypothetical protein